MRVGLPGTQVVSFNILLESIRADTHDTSAPMPTPFQSFGGLVRLLPRIMVAFAAISFIPLPSALWLGNVGEPMFAPLASLVLLLSSGLVILSWIVLLIFLLPYGKLASKFSRSDFFSLIAGVTTADRTAHR